MDAARREQSEAHSVALGRLTKRSEFLRLRGGPSWKSPSFVLVTRPQAPAAGDHARFGFTVTKRIGSAVRRNRAKRRLREAVRLTAPAAARPGFDYVVIARSGALERAFASLLEEFTDAFDRVHRRGRRGSR